MIGSAASCASSAWLATVASFVVHMVGSTWSHAAPDPTGFVLAPHLSIFALRDDKTRLQLATMTMTQQTVGSRRGAWNGASVAYRSNRRHVSSTTTRQSVATPEPAPERSIQENELRLLTWMEVEARVKQEVAEVKKDRCARQDAHCLHFSVSLAVCAASVCLSLFPACSIKACVVLVMMLIIFASRTLGPMHLGTYVKKSVALKIDVLLYFDIDNTSSMICCLLSLSGLFRSPLPAERLHHFALIAWPR